MAPSIKADGEETRQSGYNPNRVRVSLTESLQKTVYAAAGTVRRLYTSQEAVAKVHVLINKSDPAALTDLETPSRQHSLASSTPSRLRE